MARFEVFRFFFFIFLFVILMVRFIVDFDIFGIL